MKDNILHSEYLAPEIEGIDIKSQGILCTSGDTEQFVESGSYGNDDFI